MKKIFTAAIVFILALCFVTQTANAQNVGDYRTDNGGNWNSIGIWDIWDGDSWENATAGQGYPGQNNVPGSVTIANGHTVTLNVSPAFSLGSLTIAAGGNASVLNFNAGISLTVTGAVTIEGGTGNGDDKRINVADGNFSCASLTMLTTGNNNADSELRIDQGSATVTGDITMNDVATRNFIAFTNAGTLNIGGSFIGDGDILPNGANNGLVNYNGTSGTQTVKSDTYADIMFSGGAAKTIATGGIVITDDATFTSGIVTAAADATITFNDGAEALSASDASFVVGPVVKAGNDAFTFPLGNSGGSNPNRYHPISIGTPSASTTFEAEYTRGSAGSLDPDLNVGIYGVSACEYWRLDRTGANATADVTLSWNEYSGCSSNYITTLAGLIMAWYDAADSRWENSLGSSQTPTSSSPFTTGTLLRTINNVNGFGYFTFGNVSENGSPLPVKFSNLNAFEKQAGIQLNWIAYQESNLDHYRVERSADGIQFVPVGAVAAQNGVNETAYGFFDANPLPGAGFYRVRNIDLDGKTGLSNIVKVSLDKSVKDITLYPNPVRNGYLAIQSAELAKGNYAMKIFNAAGQQVYMKTFSHSGGAVNQSVQLPVAGQSGMYNLLLEMNGVKVTTKTFIVH